MKPHVFVAIPSYKAIPDVEIKRIARELGIKRVLKSGKTEPYKPQYGLHPKVWISIQNLISGSKINVDVLLGRNCTQAERARSNLILDMKKNEKERGKRYTHILQLDDDIEFPCNLVDRLVERNKDVIGAPYAYKAKDGEWRAGKMVARELPGVMPDETGLVEVRWLGGGCILWRREAWDALEKQFPECWYHKEDPETGKVTFKKQFNPYIPYIYELDESWGKYNGLRWYLSEDYASCQRARDAGFKIFLDTSITLVHWAGTIPYVLPRRIENG